MPLIQILHTAVPVERHAEIIRAVTTAYADASGKPADRVWVTIQQIEPTSWGVGGRPLSAG